MRAALEQLGPFDTVFDVGGNVGQSAELFRGLWPHAAITSFEPIAALADANRARARGRWFVHDVAISDRRGTAEIHACLDQPAASTMQTPGRARAERFGIRDRYSDVAVAADRLDHYRGTIKGRLLVKIDVEGHEAQVLAGAPETLYAAQAVIIEINAPDVFQDAPTAGEIDFLLRARGLTFAGVLDCLKDPAGDVVQFDAVYQRR